MIGGGVDGSVPAAAGVFNCIIIATKYPSRGGLDFERGKVHRVQIEAGAEPPVACEGDVPASGPLAGDGWRCRRGDAGCT